MTHLRPTPPTSPRWSVLILLVVMVLGVHLVLLTGGITLSLPDRPGSAKAIEPDNASVGTRSSIASRPPPNEATPVRVSSVRWIVPTAATVTPAPVPAPRPKPVTAKPPIAKASPPKPVVAPVQQPEPIASPAPQMEHVATAPPETAHSADAPAIEGPPPAAAPAPAEPAIAQASTPEPSPAEAPPTTPTALPPAEPPASTRLLYDVTGSVKGIGYKAQGALDWTVKNDHYEARMEMRVMLLGSRSQTSSGRIGPGGLMPERFADKSRSEKAAHFEAAEQRIRFSSNAPEVPLQPGAQDRLSLFLQLASLLQARPQAYATGQTVDMQVAGTGDAPIWRFEVGEESTISLPAGEFKVRHLTRQPRKEFDSTVEMWLAPSLHHLPVRLRVTQSNGDVADQQLMQMP